VAVPRVNALGEKSGKKSGHHSGRRHSRSRSHCGLRPLST
jgi:hypothetical protein